MKILTPFRIVTTIAAVLAALSLSLGVAAASSGNSRPAGGPGATIPGIQYDGDTNSRACVHSPALLRRNENNVINYYTIAFNDKNPKLAVKLYGGSEYIQHNPLAANGFQAFIDFVTSTTTQFPDTHIAIKRVFADCDFVITHSLGTGTIYGATGSKLVDIFRLDANGKIVEHWDVIAALSTTSANGNPEV